MIEDGKGTTRGEAIREQRDSASTVLYLEESKFFVEAKCLLARKMPANATCMRKVITREF